MISFEIRLNVLDIGSVALPVLPIPISASALDVSISLADVTSDMSVRTTSVSSNDCASANLLACSERAL